MLKLGEFLLGQTKGYAGSLHFSAFNGIAALESECFSHIESPRFGARFLVENGFVRLIFSLLGYVFQSSNVANKVFEVSPSRQHHFLLLL